MAQHHTALLDANDLCKTYDMGDVQVHALNGVSLSVATGEFVAIMGASGSGKTTLMNVLGCLDRPTTGSYRLGGHEISGLDRDRLAEVRNQVLGFVFQSFNLLARTSALDNVALPLLYAGASRREVRSRAVAALEHVGLASRLDHHPGQLSGGQQQRVAIARALVCRPRLILADEPTGNLDSATTLEIMSLFQELGRDGITIVFVTHEPDIAAFASRLVVMRDGQIITDRAQKPVAPLLPGYAAAGGER